MKKILTLAGLAAILGLFNAYAGSHDAAKPSSDTTSCPKGMACSQDSTNSAAMTCPKGDKAPATCPKSGSKAKASGACPMAKDGAKTCPVSGATGKTDKPADASQKPADKDAK